MVARIKLDEEAPAPKHETVAGQPKTAFQVKGVSVTYRAAPSTIPGKQETRRYYVGIFPLTFVEVWGEGHHPAGRFVAYLPPSEGNGGTGFGNEKDLHAFLAGKLQGT